MRIRIGCRLSYAFAQPTPIIALLNVHYSRFGDLEQPDHLLTDPPVPLRSYRDQFGNWCARLVAPAGAMTLSTTGIVHDTGLPDPAHPEAAQHAVEDLPAETLVYLLGSRYCDTDMLSDRAWAMFSGTPPGWARVQAICDFAHRHVVFGYEHARSTRTASETLAEARGVCRDYTHLAIALCRCMNIPARYCTGYLGDIGVPVSPDPMDFAGWFEAYLGGQWYTFDARNNTPRIGRVLIARGRDAADVAIATTFGPNTLKRFFVRTDEVH